MRPGESFPGVFFLIRGEVKRRRRSKKILQAERAESRCGMVQGRLLLYHGVFLSAGEGGLVLGKRNLSAGRTAPEACVGGTGFCAFFIFPAASCRKAEGFSRNSVLSEGRPCLPQVRENNIAGFSSGELMSCLFSVSCGEPRVQEGRQVRGCGGEIPRLRSFQVRGCRKRRPGETRCRYQRQRRAGRSGKGKVQRCSGGGLAAAEPLCVFRFGMPACRGTKLCGPCKAASVRTVRRVRGRFYRVRPCVRI